MSCKIIKKRDIQCSSFAKYAYTLAHMHIHNRRNATNLHRGKSTPEDKVDILQSNKWSE